MFGSRKSPCCSTKRFLVGFEPKPVVIPAMESRRRDGSSTRRSRSADSQLDDLVRARGAGGTQRQQGRGDLLRGLLPAPAGGVLDSGRAPGVRSVRVHEGSREGRTGQPESSEQPVRDGGFLSQAVVEQVLTTARDGGTTGAVTGVAGAAAAMANVASAAGAAMMTAAAGIPRSFGPTRASGVVQDDRVSEGAPGWEGRVAGAVGSGGEPPTNVEVPVNVFWSPERRAYERLHFGDGVGQQRGDRSVSDTPQDPRSGEVEMDPIELFRIRCFREAEEKYLKEAEDRFRAGLLKMSQEASSSGSFVSASDDQQTRSDTPAPPPGPSCKTPEKGEDRRSGSQPPPPPPPLPPVPPMPNWGSDEGSRSRSFGEKGLLRSDSPKGENPTESLRTFDLPKLDEEATALEFGDWLSMVDSHMGDLSYSSGSWWALVKSAVEGCYKEWLQLGPLERLRLRPQLESHANLWPRTERRALAMLLHAVPEHVRSEVISARKLTTDQVLFRLYCTYQPGGATERTKLLSAISDCRCGETVKEILNWIRTWRRYVGRAVELGVTLPDALVLVGVMQQGTDSLSQKSPQVAYRLNMIRQQLGIDQQPTTASVMTYSEHLQAEAEEMVLMGVGSVEPPQGW